MEDEPDTIVIGPTEPYVPTYYFVADEKGEIQQIGMDPVEQAYVDALDERGALYATANERPPESWVTMRSRWINPQTRQIEERPVLDIAVSKTTIAADDLDEATLSGFPDPCVVILDGQFIPLEGGVLTLTSPMPATYALKCQHWPFMTWETTIEAVA